MRKRVRAVILGAVYAIAMSVLYFVTVNFSGVTAYALGCSAVFIASAIAEHTNVAQKVFLSMTMYLLCVFFNTSGIHEVSSGTFL